MVHLNLGGFGKEKLNLNTNTTKQLVHLVLQSNFKQIFENQLPFKGIWLDFRLKGLSVESKNERIGVRTKKLWPIEVWH